MLSLHQSSFDSASNPLLLAVLHAARQTVTSKLSELITQFQRTQACIALYDITAARRPPSSSIAYLLNHHPRPRHQVQTQSHPSPRLSGQVFLSLFSASSPYLRNYPSLTSPIRAGHVLRYHPSLVQLVDPQLPFYAWVDGGGSRSIDRLLNIGSRGLGWLNRHCTMLSRQLFLTPSIGESTYIPNRYYRL
jgi:hypothetical protein